VIRNDRVTFAGGGGEAPFSGPGILGYSVFNPVVETVYVASFPAPEAEVNVESRIDFTVPASGAVLVHMQAMCRCNSSGIYAWVCSINPPGDLGFGPQTGVVRQNFAQDFAQKLAYAVIRLTGLPVGLARTLRWYHIQNVGGSGAIFTGSASNYPPQIMVIEGLP